MIHLRRNFWIHCCKIFQPSEEYSQKRSVPTKCIRVFRLLDRDQKQPKPLQSSSTSNQVLREPQTKNIKGFFFVCLRRVVNIFFQEKFTDDGCHIDTFGIKFLINPSQKHQLSDQGILGALRDDTKNINSKKCFPCCILNVGHFIFF